MKQKRKDLFDSIGCLAIVPIPIVSIFLLNCLLNAKRTYTRIINADVSFTFWVYSAVFVLVVCILLEVIVLLKNKHSIDLSQKDKVLASKEVEYKRKFAEMESTMINKINFQIEINSHLATLIKSKTPFKETAKLAADFETSIFEKDEKYLRYKPRPAKDAANKVKEIRQLFNENLVWCKQIFYKYEFLLSVFPELQLYFEDEDALIHLSDCSSYDEFDKERDRVLDWVSKSEYNAMSVDARNQLALDRYKSRKKSNWEIGVEYELYIGYLLREGKSPFNKKYYVIQFGELNGIHDLGRDIIAEMIDLNGQRIIYVIQCKRWSETKIVHENAICQLYGSTIEYKISHRNYINCRFIPVFVTTTDVSETAQKFAKQLGVEVLKIPIGNYPMIKCNINNGTKIYHLPFDQQYHSTQIKNEGEFYAMTVQEAVQRGFRRAYRHFQTPK